MPGDAVVPAGKYAWARARPRATWLGGQGGGHGRRESPGLAHVESRHDTADIYPTLTQGTNDLLSTMVEDTKKQK
jgi:hypothetical protein